MGLLQGRHLGKEGEHPSVAHNRRAAGGIPGGGIQAAAEGRGPCEGQQNADGSIFLGGPGGNRR